MVVGLWISYDLSVAIVCSEVLVGVTLLALAFWAGKRSAASGYSRLAGEEGLVQPLVPAGYTDLDRVTVDALALHTGMSLHPSGVLMPPEFFNKACSLGWPLIAQFGLNILHEQIEPALQLAMPKGMGTIVVDDKTSMGEMKPEILAVECIPLTLPTNRFGDVKAMRCLVHMRYAGDVKVSITADMRLPFVDKIKSMAKSVMEVVHKTAESTAEKGLEIQAGVEQVVVEGTCVCEMFNLTADPPFMSGMRIYFPNTPSIDFQVLGDFGKLMNLKLLKERILVETEKVFNSMFVLPNRMCIAMRNDVDIWAIKTARPRGIARIAVLEVHGAKECCVRLRFGATKYRTPPQKGDGNLKWAAGTAADFLVCETMDQFLEATIFIEEHNLVWGNHKGEILGTVAILASDLLRDTCGGDGTCWLNLSQAKPGGVSDMSRSATLKSTASEPDSGLCVKLQVEWRQIEVNSEQAVALSRGQSTYNNWSLKKTHSHVDCSTDVVCQMVVCLHSIHNVPFREEYARKYWCVVTKTANDESKEPTEEITSKRVAAIWTDPKDAHKIVKHDSAATWMQTLTFNMHAPHLATVTIEVQTAVGRGTPETIGTLTRRVADLLVAETNTVAIDCDVGKAGCKLQHSLLKAWLIGPKTTFEPRAVWPVF